MKTLAKIMCVILLPFFTCLLPLHNAEAHKPSDSYLTLARSGAGITGRLDINLKDLEYALGLDVNRDGDLQWGEIESNFEKIDNYAFFRLTIDLGPDCKTKVIDHQLTNHSDGTYLVTSFERMCPKSPSALALSYKLLFDLDPSHRAIISVIGFGESQAIIASPQSSNFLFSSGKYEDSKLNQAFPFFRSGVWHIWSGYDHLLFLLSLLLPVAFFRKGRHWEPLPKIKPAILDIARIVTSFSVAHSITLSLVILGIITLPSRFVEAAIAFSVIVSALNNIWPILPSSRWSIAFLFGLIHGCGFASVLLDAGLPKSNLLGALLGFNLGVETGQLAVVACILPILYLSRRSLLYRPIVLVGGSSCAAASAAVWLVERICGV